MIRALEPVQNLARLSEKALIFENRSAAYIEVCEQRITGNQCFFAKIVEILNRLLYFSIFSLISMNAFAAPYYCLETNQIVNEGDSMEKVQAACGVPTRVSIKDEIASAPTEITEWVYIGRPADPTKTSNYLARLIVVFNSKGKVTQLKQSQMQNPNDQTNVTCGVGAVKVGDDMPTVQVTCGNPSFINKLQSSEKTTKKVVEWSYQKSSSLTPLVFRFENGILIEIKNE